MSLKKISQDLDGFMVSMDEADDLLSTSDVADLRIDLELEAEDEAEQSIIDQGPNVEGEINISLEDSEDNIHKEFSFTLPEVPGGEDQSDLPEPQEEEVTEEADPWKWTVPNFLDWLQTKLSNVPRHSGKDLSGLERAVAYLEFLDKEISKAVRMDIKNQITIDAVEKARDEIQNGIQRLEDRIEKIKAFKKPSKKKKKAFIYTPQDGFVKSSEAESSLRKDAQMTASFTVVVPIFISHIARICVNSSVSAGHDIEDTFEKLSKKYKLDDRERASVIQVISDMGYGSIWMDRGLIDEEEIDISSSNNYDWSAQYQS